MTDAENASTSAGLAGLQELAARHGALLSLPEYPATADDVANRTAAAIAGADAAVAAVVGLPPEARNFASTFAAIDAVTAAIGDLAGQVGTVAQAATGADVRDAANAAQVRLQEWSVGLAYREDLYLVLRSVAGAGPAPGGQEQRLVDDTMRDYRRAGFSLPAEERAKLEELLKELAALNTAFAVNINQARAPLDFTAAELAGVPASFLESPGVKQTDGGYRVLANVTWHATTVLEHADDPAVRRRVLVERHNLARGKNVPLLTRLVALRGEIARRLGYASWADYQLETRMARNGAAAVRFEEDLVAALQPKFDAELSTLRALKTAHTGDAGAAIEPWDVAYYTNRLLRERYAVDTEALRAFFPYRRVLEGMFAVCERTFGLRIVAAGSPAVWAPGVRLFVVQDASTAAPLGAFLLDMFPREGKFNHFACFPQKSGRLLPDGTRELPVMALLCNFPAPSDSVPSLLKHDDVVTLFHEFGHVLHALLGRSPFAYHAAFAVPHDFIEVPSQALENWAWDRAVLDTFAADHRDPARKIPAGTIAAMEAARCATEGYGTRRQLALGLIDLGLHARPADRTEGVDVVAESNAVFARVALPPAEGTAFVAFFGHLAGYDAGYYGYLWAKVLSLDVAEEFRRAPDGFLDAATGRRFRDEILVAAHTREVEVSAERFLRRPRSNRAFLEHIGLGR